MQNSLKALISHKPTINLWWMITMRCNYRCWYCASYDNNLPNDKFKSWDEYVSALYYLRSLWNEEERIILTLTGGEPLLFRNWDVLIGTEIPNFKVNILTNLSIPFKTLKQKTQRIKGDNDIIVSYHASFSNYKDILPKLLYLKSKNMLQAVKVLNDTKYKDKVNAAYELFSEHDLPIIFTYLDNQVDENRVIGSNISINNSKKTTVGRKYLELVFENTSIVENSDYVYRHELNNFKGMLCNMGQRNLYFDYLGNAYPAACMLNFPKTRMGNMFERNIQLYTKPKTCPFSLCACGSDFDFSKWDKNYYEKTYQQQS